MDEIRVVSENPDDCIVLLESPKRTKKIKLFIPRPSSFGHWRITYEDNQPIKELQGSYLSKKEAIRAVNNWLVGQNKTEQAKHLEIFGEKKEIPQLRYKKRGAKHSKIDS